MQWIVGDASDPASLAAAVAECDVVYHLAGLTMALDERDLHRVNATGAQTAACNREQGWLPKPGLLLRLARR